MAVLKVYNGTSWADAVMKSYNGAGWEGAAKFWNGSAWVALTAAASDFSIGAFPATSTWDNDIASSGTNTLDEWGNGAEVTTVTNAVVHCKIDFYVDYANNRIEMRTSEQTDGTDTWTTHYIDIGTDWDSADAFYIKWTIDTTSTAAHPGTSPSTDYGVTETVDNPFTTPADNNSLAENSWHLISESSGARTELHFKVTDTTTASGDACVAIFGLDLFLKGISGGTDYPDATGNTIQQDCWLRAAKADGGGMGGM